jgi:hypothetical protein
MTTRVLSLFNSNSPLGMKKWQNDALSSFFHEFAGPGDSAHAGSRVLFRRGWQ